MRDGPEILSPSFRISNYGLTFEMRGAPGLPGDVLSIEGLGHAFKRSHRINLD